MYQSKIHAFQGMTMPDGRRHEIIGHAMATDDLLRGLIAVFKF
jgi:hypothetical protein